MIIHKDLALWLEFFGQLNKGHLMFGTIGCVQEILFYFKCFHLSKIHRIQYCEDADAIIAVTNISNSVTNISNYSLM